MNITAWLIIGVNVACIYEAVWSRVWFCSRPSVECFKFVMACIVLISSSIIFSIVALNMSGQADLIDDKYRLYVAIPLIGSSLLVYMFSYLINHRKVIKGRIYTKPDWFAAFRNLWKRKIAKSK